jgi:biopolymer transport protein ExbD
MKTAGIALVAAVLLLGVNYLAFVDTLDRARVSGVSLPPINHSASVLESVQIVMQTATLCLIDGESVRITDIKARLVRAGKPAVTLVAPEGVPFDASIEAMDQIREAGVAHVTITQSLPPKQRR